MHRNSLDAAGGSRNNFRTFQTPLLLFIRCIAIIPVTEHYRGNRQRNQLVREDFPTAVGEQEKELIYAEQQAARRHERVQQLSETDALVAQQLAERLAHEADQQRRMQAAQDEALSRQLQLQQATTHHAAAMEQQLQQQHHQRGGAAPRNAVPLPPKNFPQRLDSDGVSALHQHHNHQQQQQQHRRQSPSSAEAAGAAVYKQQPTLNYVSLDLSGVAGAPQFVPAGRPTVVDTVGSPSRTQYTEIVPQSMQLLHSVSQSPSPVKSQYDHLVLQSHTPEKPVANAAADQQQQHRLHDHNRNATRSKALAYPSSHQQQQPSDDDNAIRSLQDDGAASDPFPFNVNRQHSRAQQQQQSHSRQQSGDAEVQQNLASGLAHSVQKLSLEKYDLLVGNATGDSVDGNVASSATLRTRAGEANGNAEWEYRRGSPSGPALTRDRLRELQEFGVPADEIVEINRIITQQERDEELARKLQIQENANLTFEEQDRLVAMEAQDKELARMLQERVSAECGL